MSIGRIRGAQGFEAGVDEPTDENATTGDILLTALGAHSERPVVDALRRIAEEVYILSRVANHDVDLDAALLGIYDRIRATAILADRLHGESAFARETESTPKSAVDSEAPSSRRQKKAS